MTEGEPATRTHTFSSRDHLAHAVIVFFLLDALIVSASALTSVLRGMGVAASLSATAFRWLSASLIGACWLSLFVSINQVRRWRRKQGQKLSWALRVLLAVAVLGTVARLIVLERADPSSVRLFWGIAIQAFSAAILLKDSITRLAPERVLRAIDLVSFNLCLFLVGAEGVLRLYARVHPSPVLTTAAASVEQRLSAHRLEPGQIWLGFPANSQGYIDDEPIRRPGERLIAMIGDSFATGVVPHHYHYTTVLERGLARTQVYNIGVPAIAGPEYVYLLQHDALPLKPELVILSVFVGNDISETFDEMAASDVQRAFSGREFQLITVAKRIAILARHPIVNQPEQQLSSELRARVIPPERLSETFPWLDDPLKEPMSLTRQSYLAVERARARFLASGPESSYQPFFRCLERMQQMTGSDRFAVVLIPDEFQVEDRLWRMLASENDLADSNRQRAQKVLTAELSRRGIPTLDLLPALRAQSPLADGDLHLYHFRDTHLNRRGNRVAGLELRTFVVQHFGFEADDKHQE